VTTTVSERDEVERRWREAENRLYPIVTVRPDLYEVSVRLVRSLADHLSAVPDVDALVTSFQSATVKDDLDAIGVDPQDISEGIDVTLVRAAAYQVRSRELVQREALDRTTRSIERARKAGEPSAVIWSAGENDLAPGFRRVEMALTTGFAVSTSTELNPETMQPHFIIESFQLDVETGEATGDPPISPRTEFTDPQEWREAAAELRRRLLTTTEEDTDGTA
jgi:hypothetical protein